jgi:hypothetical protein
MRRPLVDAVCAKVGAAGGVRICARVNQASARIGAAHRDNLARKERVRLRNVVHGGAHALHLSELVLLVVANHFVDFGVEDFLLIVLVVVGDVLGVGVGRRLALGDAGIAGAAARLQYDVVRVEAAFGLEADASARDKRRLARNVVIGEAGDAVRARQISTQQAKLGVESLGLDVNRLVHVSVGRAARAVEQRHIEQQQRLALEPIAQCGVERRTDHIAARRARRVNGVGVFDIFARRAGTSPCE